MVDIEGLSIPEDREWGRRKWCASLFGLASETHFKVFIFSLSLSTTFGGTGVEARSPYNLLLANLNTLMAQLIFVFLSGAGKLNASPLVRLIVFLCTFTTFKLFSSKSQMVRGDANVLQFFNAKLG